MRALARFSACWCVLCLVQFAAAVQVSGAVGALSLLASLVTARVAWVFYRRLP